MRLPSLPPSLPPPLLVTFLLSLEVCTNGREGGRERRGIACHCHAISSTLTLSPTLAPSLPPCPSVVAMEPLRRSNHAAPPSSQPGRDRQEGRAADDRRHGGTLLPPSLPSSLPPSLPPSFPPSAQPGRDRQEGLAADDRRLGGMHYPSLPPSLASSSPILSCNLMVDLFSFLPPSLPPSSSRPRAARHKPPRFFPPPTPSSKC